MAAKAKTAKATAKAETATALTLGKRTKRGIYLSLDELGDFCHPLQYRLATKWSSRSRYYLNGHVTTESGKFLGRWWLAFHLLSDMIYKIRPSRLSDPVGLLHIWQRTFEHVALREHKYTEARRALMAHFPNVKEMSFICSRKTAKGELRCCEVHLRSAPLEDEDYLHWSWLLKKDEERPDLQRLVDGVYQEEVGRILHLYELMQEAWGHQRVVGALFLASLIHHIPQHKVPWNDSRRRLVKLKVADAVIFLSNSVAPLQRDSWPQEFFSWTIVAMQAVGIPDSYEELTLGAYNED